MKRILCTVLAVILLLGIVWQPPPVNAASNMTVSAELVSMIKSFEGFCKRAVRDGNQHSVGYGTGLEYLPFAQLKSCQAHNITNLQEALNYYQNNDITVEEATEFLEYYLGLFCNAINAFIDKYGLTLSQQQFDALISLSYNCGSGWTKETSGTLHNAVKSGATGNELLYAFSLWSKSAVSVSPGLVRRRLAEGNLYLNGTYSTSEPENYYYVVFDANGGIVNYPVQGYDASLDAPILVSVADTITVTVNGKEEVCTFDGWYTAKRGGTKVTALTGALGYGSTLYAHWKTADGTVIEPPKPAAKPVDNIEITVTATGVNVRKGPGTDYEKVGEATKGQKLVLTQVFTELSGRMWGMFDTEKWICLDYTDYKTVIQNGATPEIPTQPPTTAPPATQPPATQPPATQPPATQPPATEPGDPVDPLSLTVTATNVNVRKGPGTNYDKVGMVTRGDKITVSRIYTGSDGLPWGMFGGMKWIRLDFTDYAAVTKPTDPPATKPTDPPVTQPPVTDPGFTPWKGTVQVSDTLHVRSGPGTYNSIVGYLKAGTEVTILEEKTVDGERWGRVEKGWISLRYVKQAGTSDPEPTEPPETKPPVTDPPATEPPTTPTTPPAGSTGNWHGKVQAKQILYIRAQPGAAGTVVGNLLHGTAVTVTERVQVDGKVWGRVEKGWICLDYVDMDDPTVLSAAPMGNGTGSTVLETPVTMTVEACSLRIRSGAGVTNEIVSYLPLGEQVTILELKPVGGIVWARTDAGWVNQSYLK